MRLLLFGAGGQLGHELRRSLPGLGDIVVATRSGMLADGTACERADFDEPGSLPALIDRVAPDVVVNAAAYTAVDRAESERDAAFRVNSEALVHIARACAARDALLVHYSTDYVFDGTASRPYREDDPVAPLGVYGESKLAGELAVQQSGARHLIFRTGWVHAAHGHNFLLTMLRRANEREELRVVADQIGAPTSACLIADTTADILRQPFRGSGLWHLTATGSTSWHGFAVAIVEQAHARGLIERRPGVVPIATADCPTPARRPMYSCLETRALRTQFDVELPSWQEDCSRVLDQVRTAA